MDSSPGIPGNAAEKSRAVDGPLGDERAPADQPSVLEDPNLAELGAALDRQRDDDRRDDTLDERPVDPRERDERPERHEPKIAAPVAGLGASERPARRDRLDVDVARKAPAQKRGQVGVARR